MKYKYTLILVFFYSGFISAQNSKSLSTGKKPLLLDVYGSLIPFFDADFQVLSSLHLSLSFDQGLRHGPCMSMWSYYDSYEGFRFLGLGYQIGPKLDKMLIKLEGGILLSYLRRESERYRVVLSPGSTAPYLRLHLGFRFKKRFVWGGQINWIPSTASVYFKELINFRPGQSFEDFRQAPNRHFSPGVFVGISLD